MWVQAWTSAMSLEGAARTLAEWTGVTAVTWPWDPIWVLGHGTPETQKAVRLRARAI